MKIQDFIFCDDVRTELGSKLSFMGVYNDRVILNVPAGEKIEGPLPLVLSLVLRVRFEENEPRPETFDFSYLIDGKKHFAVSDRLLANAEERSSNLIFPRIVFPVSDNHRIGFSLQLKRKGVVAMNEVLQDAIRIEIRKNMTS